MKVLNNHILVLVEKLGGTKSGLVLVSKEDMRVERAEVILVDKSVRSIKKGDFVYFKKYSLSEVSIDNKDYSFVNADEVLAVE